MDTKKLTRGALLIVAALTLSYLERFLPLNLLIPLPGVKLGLANLVTMFALYHLPRSDAFTVLVLRCLLGSVFSGISGLAMSLTGGMAAFWTMDAAKRCPMFSVYGVSILGAAAHNLGQVVAASVMMGSVYTFYYLPFLLLTALATGLLTGTVCAYTFQNLPTNAGQEGSHEEQSNV